MANAFDSIPRNIKEHFRLNFYAAVYLILHTVRRLSPEGNQDLSRTVERYPFLAKYLQEMLPFLPGDVSWDAMPIWWRDEILNWEGKTRTRLPLVILKREGSLPFVNRILLMLIGLVEEDSRFGTLFAGLQQPLAFRRPCLELLGQIMAAIAEDGWDIALACQSLVAEGMVDLINEEAPRSEWLLRVPPPLWDAMRGEIPNGMTLGYALHGPDDFGSLNRLRIDAAFLQQLQQVPLMVKTGKARTIVLRGMYGSEHLQVMGAIAKTLKLGIVALAQNEGHNDGREEKPSLRHCGPLCALLGYMPVVTYDLTPGESADAPALTVYKGPVGIILGPEGGITEQSGAAVVSLTLPLLRAEQRQYCWQDAFGKHQVEDLAVIKDRFHIPSGHIKRVAQAAIAQAALSQRDIITREDVRQASRMLNRQGLEMLAASVEVEGNWQQLVVSEAVNLKLQELMQRCRHRERLLDYLGAGFGSKQNWGVRALLSGASGTGKTLAAKILAAELNMDLYRVDLGAVVNKYVGVTEKNLHRVLSKAEELDVILLLDEGDSLLGNRTDIKSANDRYANLETNYLLQRLENYQGIVIVTTNAVQSIDRAFQRRMDVVINLVPPQAWERLRIWQLHLPEHHALDAGFLEQIAIRCQLTGGQIRNAALYATLLAMDNGGVRPWHVEEAVRSEYRKAGAICPLDGVSPDQDNSAEFQAFLGVLNL